jgi:hypothetical protein
LILAVWSICKEVSCQNCNDGLKSVRGCNGFEKEKIIAGVKAEYCPAKYLDGRTGIYLESIRAFRMGQLNLGDYLDWPIKFTQVMSIVEDSYERFKDDGRHKP